MKNYFNEYKKAKISLCRMVNQFLTCYMNIENAKKLNLNIDNEYFVINNYVEVCTHGNSFDGHKAWEILGLTREFISHEEIFNLENIIYYEKETSNIDYYAKYSNIVILLIDLVTKYYSKELSIEEANKIKLKYNANSDILNNHIVICDNLYESAGKSVWALLNIKEERVPITRFLEIKKQFINSLNNSDKKVKVLKKIEVDLNK